MSYRRRSHGCWWQLKSECNAAAAAADDDDDDDDDDDCGVAVVL